MTDSDESKPSDAKHRRLMLVVPCYNEAQRLPVAAFTEFLDKHLDIGISFVDDGSRDATRSVLQGIVDRYPAQACLIPLEVNRGKAEAVRQGLRQTIEQGADWFGYWDADLATPLDEVLRMREILQTHSGIDAVLGSRVQLLGRKICRQRSRHYIGRVFATMASWVLRMPVYDTQCGAKVFRASPAMTRAVNEAFTTRWIFDVELLARLVVEYDREGRSFVDACYELPLNRWEDVAGSKLRWTDFPRAIRDLARIRHTYNRLRVRRNRM